MLEGKKAFKNCPIFGLNSQIDTQFAVFLFDSHLQCPTQFDSHSHLDNSIRLAFAKS